MSEKRFDVGQRVRVNVPGLAINGREGGLVYEDFPDMVKVRMDDGVVWSLSGDEIEPADPAPTATDELQQARAAVDEAKAGVAMARGLDWQATALSVLADELDAQNAAQQQRIAEMEAWQASAKTALRSHTHVLQDILAPHALLGDDMEMAVGRVLKRIEALEKALEPFANMGDIFVNSKTIHPSYNGRDREIYSLNDAVLTRRDFERAYEALHADEKG